MLKNIQKFRELTSVQRKLFVEAYVRLIWVQLILKSTSFKYATRKLKQSDIQVFEKIDVNKALMIGNVIKMAAGHILGKNTCLVQSITAQKMLEQRAMGGELHIGVTKVEHDVKAHAWVTYNDEVIVGEYEYELYESIVTFIWSNE